MAAPPSAPGAQVEDAPWRATGSGALSARSELRNFRRSNCRSFVAALLASILFPVGAPAVTSAPPIDPDEGRPRVDWKDAGQVVGRIAFVSGKVAEVREAGRITFLDFDAASREGFVAPIFKEFLEKFPEPPAKLYKDKIIRIRGYVTTHQGQPQIQVRSPSQIEVLAEPPPLKPLTKHAAKVGDEITIATYNVLNLFDDADDPYNTDETTPAKPRSELENLAKSIRALNADVIAMQEVENRGILERFIEVFLADMGYDHIALFEGNEIRGIDVALVSRIPIGAVTSNRHREFPDGSGGMMRFERDLLQVRLEPLGGRAFEVWVVHLKSNYEGKEYAEPIRRAEAAEVRRILDKRLTADPAARILVCGDFNDTPESATIRTLLGDGSHALKAFYQEIPEDKRITYNKPPYLTMIDFLLVTNELANGYVAGSYTVRPGIVEESGSDHNPVSARFRIK